MMVLYILTALAVVLALAAHRWAWAAALGMAAGAAVLLAALLLCRSVFVRRKRLFLAFVFFHVMQVLS